MELENYIIYLVSWWSCQAYKANRAHVSLHKTTHTKNRQNI